MSNASPDLANRLDLALWSPTASSRDYEALFTGALKLRARAVCVPTGRVGLAAARFEDSSVKTVALVGFPLGLADTDAKRFEAEAAIDNGAQELEVVLNHALVKDGATAQLLREFRDLVECTDERPVFLSAELSWLTKEEVFQLGHLALDAGITGIAAGTGFWPNLQVAAPDILLLREATFPKFLIKAAALGEESRATALRNAGADRVGLAFDPARMT